MLQPFHFPRVVYKSRQLVNFAGFSARFPWLLSLLHGSRYVEEMMFIRSHNRLLFTKLWLLKNLKNSSHHDTEPWASTTQNSRKKHTIDWSHEFAPGNGSSLDYDKSDLPNFVTGFLLLVKPYEITKKNAMLDYLQLLMFNLGFKQLSSCQEIRDKAVTFFEHSDLCPSQNKSNLATPPLNCGSLILLLTMAMYFLHSLWQ